MIISYFYTQKKKLIKLSPDWLTCSPFEILWEGRGRQWREPAQSAYFRNTIRIGAALTEPENEISQNHTGSRAGAENFHSHPNVTKCNLSLCMASSFMWFDSTRKSNKRCSRGHHFCCSVLASSCLPDFIFFSAEWAEEQINYLESLRNYYLNFCTPHPCQIEKGTSTTHIITAIERN